MEMVGPIDCVQKNYLTFVLEKNITIFSQNLEADLWIETS